MKKRSRNIIFGTALSTKKALAAGSLALLLAACGGGNTDMNSNKAAGQTTSPPVETSQALTPDDLPKALLDGNYKEIYARFDQPLKDAVSAAELEKTGAEFTKDIHRFEKLSTMQLNGYDKRIWVSDSGDKGLLGMFNPDGVITSILVQHLTASPETDKNLSKNEYALPFEGDWLVFWGGDNVLVNYHYEYENQRYAYDFVQEKEHFSYEGDPLKNESYYAFGQKIAAPADGTVISVTNDIVDNEPVGVMNPNQPAGNIVVIDHGGEFSHLAHLKKGSITVMPGDKVKKGDIIGLTGNSGNSSEPHLHFQLSDGADLFTARSIHIWWEDEMKPIQGQTITAAKPSIEPQNN